MDPVTAALIAQGASTGLNFLGGLFSGNSQEKLTKEQLAQQERLANAQMENQRRTTEAALVGSAGQGTLNREQDRGKMGLEATQMDPLAQQRSRQRAAVMAAMLGNARPFSITPGGGGNDNFMPTFSGGFQVPEGGFGPETLAFSTPQARYASDLAFQKQATRVDPSFQAPDLGAAGYGAMAKGASAQLADVAARQQEELKGMENTQLQAVLDALNRKVQRTAVPRDTEKNNNYIPALSA